ncbi:MAG: uracil-DNA glycosylase [Candidatus Gastranaerophilales bacterium]|nr:uracil-DNA glycosylase [Candidatus Gastranaerophilales bacterium]
MNDSNKNITHDEKIKILTELKKVCSQCSKCELSKGRTNIVFSDGNPDAKIMLIGEAPGHNEDVRGVPFVGRAGQLLDTFLQEHNISRKDDIYICNTVKCRPPENRVPKPDEKKACRKYLDAQIKLVKPEIILLCGSTAVQSFLDTKLTISKIRGQWFENENGIKMMPIFHPSYLLRNHSLEENSPRWLMHKDLENIKSELRKLC